MNGRRSERRRLLSLRIFLDSCSTQVELFTNGGEAPTSSGTILWSLRVTSRILWIRTRLWEMQTLADSKCTRSLPGIPQRFNPKNALFMIFFKIFINRVWIPYPWDFVICLFLQNQMEQKQIKSLISFSQLQSLKVRARFLFVSIITNFKGELLIVD